MTTTSLARVVSRPISRKVSQTTGSPSHIIQMGTEFMSLVLSHQTSSSMSSWPLQLTTWLRLRASPRPRRPKQRNASGARCPGEGCSPGRGSSQAGCFGVRGQDGIVCGPALSSALALCSGVTQRSQKMRSRCWRRSLSRKQREKGFPQQPRSVLVGLGLGEALVRDQVPP